MDGTVLDSMPMWISLETTLLDEHKIDLPSELRSKLERMSLQNGAAYIAEHFDIGMTGPEVYAKWMGQVSLGYKNTVILRPYIIEYLQKLKNEGVKSCIATLTGLEHATDALKHHGLLDYFEFVLTVDEVGKSKKYPDIYIESARRLGADITDCVVFEDSLYAAATAKNAGFYVVGVYDEISSLSVPQLSEICDRVIFDFEELL